MGFVHCIIFFSIGQATWWKATSPNEIHDEVTLLLIRHIGVVVLAAGEAEVGQSASGQTAKGHPTGMPRGLCHVCHGQEGGLLRPVQSRPKRQNATHRLPQTGRQGGAGGGGRRRADGVPRRGGAVVLTRGCFLCVCFFFFCRCGGWTW